MNPQTLSASDFRLDAPVEIARDAQFRLRLEREEKTISRLNHPHICTL